MSRTAPEVTGEAVESIRELSFVEWVDNEREWLVVGFEDSAGSEKRSEIDRIANGVSGRLSRESEPHPREKLREIGVAPPEGIAYEVYFLEPSHL